MKYSEIIYVTKNNAIKMNPENYSVKELEEFDLAGQFKCSGKNCNAKLCLVHNSINGGKTCFFKAVDDDEHSKECEYKIGNYTESHVTVRKDGIYTEKQVNDAVRRIAHDYSNPKKDGTKNKSKNTKSNRKSDEVENENISRKMVAQGGKIVYGEDSNTEIKGRMNRRYEVSSKDIGIMATICGNAKKIYFDQHNDMYISFRDSRLQNIQVYLGPVYEHNNPLEYSNLHLIKEYFDRYTNEKEIQIAAGGLVNMQNSKLILELQSNGSLRIDDQTVMKMIYRNTKKSFDKM